MCAMCIQRRIRQWMDTAWTPRLGVDSLMRVRSNAEHLKEFESNVQNVQTTSKENI